MVCWPYSQILYQCVIGQSPSLECSPSNYNLFNCAQIWLSKMLTGFEISELIHISKILDISEILGISELLEILEVS